MLKLDPVALTDIGRKRDHNEDYLGDLIIRDGQKYDQKILADKGYLFAVADGMGGYAAGEVASELAINTLFDNFYGNPNKDNLVGDLLNAIHLANSVVHRTGEESGHGQMGTTLTLALIKGNRLLAGNVGDSRTYLIRSGIPLRVTRDHSLVQDQIDIGAITPEQAQRSMIKNIITRAVGHRDEVEPDLFEHELQQGDIILLCSDGLHGLVQELELSTIVTTAPTLKKAARQLIDLANERGGVDNISVVLIGISELGDPIPPFLGGQPSLKAELSATVPMSVVPQSTMKFPAARDENEASTKRTKAIPETNGIAANPEIETPTLKIPASGEKKGGKGILWLLVIILLAAAGVVAYVVVNNSGDNNSQTATTATPKQTDIPTVTPTTPVTAITTQTGTTATGGALGALTNPPGALPISPKEPVTIDRATITAVQIKIPAEVWGEEASLNASDLRLELSLVTAGTKLSLKYNKTDPADNKIVYVFDGVISNESDLPVGIYNLLAFNKNKAVTGLNSYFSKQQIEIQNNKVISTAQSMNFTNNILQLTFISGIVTGIPEELENQHGPNQGAQPSLAPVTTP